MKMKMKYEDVNWGEISAILEQLCLEVEDGLTVTVNDIKMSCYSVELTEKGINLLIEDEAIDIKEIKDEEDNDNS